MTDDYAARLGLIVLQSDETIEPDFVRLLPPTVRLHTTRVPSALHVTRETLAEMAHTLPQAAGLFPRGARFDAVAYGCTSGASVIGQAEVARLVRTGCDTARVTDPVTALTAACARLGVERIALLSPYVAAVSDGLRAVLAEAGITAVAVHSFDISEEAAVARMRPEPIRAAALDLARHPDAQAVFMSCTNLPAIGLIPELEQATGKPMLSSNQVLAWHLCDGLAVGPLPDLHGTLGRA